MSGRRGTATNGPGEPLGLSADELLSTTRAVRFRLDFERPVELAVITDCLRLALQAPTGAGVTKGRWVIVRDPDQRLAVADIYRSVMDHERQAAGLKSPDPATRKIFEGAVYLAANLHRAPIIAIACVEGHPDPTHNAAQPSGLFGSILPAVWSFQLALRSRGLGSCWTTAHLRAAEEMAALLRIPPEYMQAVLLPVAYTKGTDFRPARRLPVEEVMYVDRWGHRSAHGAAAIMDNSWA